MFYVDSRQIHSSHPSKLVHCLSTIHEVWREETLDQYLKELTSITLEKNWAHLVREKILTTTQGNRKFIDWKIEMENLNAILTTSAKTFALSRQPCGACSSYGPSILGQ